MNGPDSPGSDPRKTNYIKVCDPYEKEMVETMKRLEAMLKRWKERNKPLQISIPEAESSDQPGIWYHKLTAGTTNFNFYDGSITIGEQRTLMRNSLRIHGEEYVRSIRLFVDKDVRITIDGESETMIVGGETVVLSEQQFQQLYVTASVDTNIRLFASTAMHPIDVNMIAPPVAYEYVYDASTVGTNIVTIDMGIFSKTILEIVASSTVPIAYTLTASMDNLHWFTMDSFGACTVMHKGYQNAFRYVRLTAAPGGPGNMSMLIVATSM
jgi:hypothetical protein